MECEVLIGEALLHRDDESNKPWEYRRLGFFNP